MEYKNLTDVPGITKITPQKYVWHVSPKRNRQSILNFGLNAELSEHKCVFANNQSRNIDFFYPFCVDIYYECFRDEDYLEYDYWRIDISKVNGIWYIDPNMKNGPKEFMGSSRNFIVTESSVPAEALTLFKIDARFLRTYKMFAVKTVCEEGVLTSHYSSKDEIPSNVDIIEIKEFSSWYISSIREERDEGVVNFIANKLPLIKHELLNPTILKRAA